MSARFSATDYAAALMKLLPRGRVWPREPGSTQATAVACFAPAMERVDAAAVQLLADAFPGSTTNLLDEWEASLGLPDPCLGADATLLQRRAQVLSRITDSGGQSAQRFIDFAAQLGFVIEITTFAPFRTGRSRVGSPLNSPDWSFGWNPDYPGATALLLTLQRVFDPIAALCGVAAIATFKVSERGMVEQLRRRPFPIDMWASLPMLKRPAAIAVLSLIAAIGVVSTR